MSRIVDLTQPLGPETVLWPGSSPVRLETIATIDPDGYFGREVHSPEHAGTHLDAPAHFAPRGDRVDGIAAERLVVSCAVLDVSQAAAADADLRLDLPMLAELEERDGPVAAGSAVLLRTGWDARRGDPDAYLGSDGDGGLSFPGFGEDAATALVERGVVGLGIDTLGVDPGAATDYPVHHITLPAGLWHLEGLVGLEALPARGATLFVGVLKLEGGSGAPARVMALVP